MTNTPFFATKTGKAVIIIIGYIVIIGLFLLSSVTPVTYYTVAALAIFFGWKFLNRITPNMFLFLNLWGWFLYFFIKLFLSVAVGVFVAPYQLAKMIANAVSNSVANKQ